MLAYLLHSQSVSQSVSLKSFKGNKTYFDKRAGHRIFGLPSLFWVSLVLFVLLAPMSSSSIVVAGETTSNDLNSGADVQQFFQGKVVNEEGLPISNIMITISDVLIQTTVVTDQFGDFSFPIKNVEGGSVRINEQNSNKQYSSGYLRFTVSHVGTEYFLDRLDISDETISIAARDLSLPVQKNKLTIKLSESPDVKKLKKLYHAAKDANDYKEFIKKGNSFLEANQYKDGTKDGTGELQQLVSEAIESLPMLVAEEERPALVSFLVIEELKRLKENKDFEAIVSLGRSHLNKYPNTQNSYLSEIQALVEDAENEPMKMKAAFDAIIKGYKSGEKLFEQRVQDVHEYLSKYIGVKNSNWEEVVRIEKLYELKEEQQKKEKQQQEKKEQQRFDRMISTKKVPTKLRLLADETMYYFRIYIQARATRNYDRYDRGEVARVKFRKQRNELYKLSFGKKYLKLVLQSYLVEVENAIDNLASDFDEVVRAAKTDDNDRNVLAVDSYNHSLMYFKSEYGDPAVWTDGPCPGHEKGGDSIRNCKKEFVKEKKVDQWIE